MKGGLAALKGESEGCAVGGEGVDFEGIVSELEVACGGMPEAVFWGDFDDDAALIWAGLKCALPNSGEILGNDGRGGEQEKEEELEVEPFHWGLLDVGKPGFRLDSIVHSCRGAGHQVGLSCVFWMVEIGCIPV